jgi:glycosyltransferase involved in cell wall biosynthesis
MPTVDIIMPAFNAAKYLTSALDSVASQTFQDWCIVLVDDGSTDETCDVLSPYIERLGDKFKYIRTCNAGPSAARNAAIRNSSSEFLAFLDADDVWLPGRLAASLKRFEERPQAGLSYGMVRFIDAEGRITPWQDRRQKYAEGKIAAHIYTRRINLPCLTITVRRKCIEDVGLFDEEMRATEDRDLWLRIALKYEVCFVEQVIAHYRMSPSSASADLNRMLQGQLKFVEKHRGVPGCGELQRRSALARIYKQQADALSLRRQPRAALKSSLRALALNPIDASNLRATASLLLKWAATTQR